ncbi:hypothetical protein NDU88_005943 [Pleurodeles waltl]|uniref:Mannose-6-phosphate isomerase n=1 Tax=Pleurodeles waltl TaxID=8319 RepID=A0AAV7VPP4_PLEWA|nr:hypothetical protein NDU88_005943 [Pleurodeles waltl]
MTRSIPQYHWGTIASDLPYPDAVLSGSNQQRRPGDEGICKSLLDVAQTVTGETGATEERGETAAAQETATTPLAAAAAQETAAAAVAAAAARETAMAPEAETVTTPKGAPQEETPREVGRTVRVPPCPADAELSLTTVFFPPLQQPKGLEAGNPKNRSDLGRAWP